MLILSAHPSRLMIDLFPIGYDLRASLLPSGFSWLPKLDTRRPDALVATDLSSVGLRSSILPAWWLSALPLIGCDASLEERADIIVQGVRSLPAALAELSPIITRAKKIAWEKIVADENDLLAFLFIRSRDLEPIADPLQPETLFYQEQCRFTDLEKQAERLVNERYLEVKDAETVNNCPVCGSARLLVREVCSACGSSDVIDEAILHHFDCAYQGPKSGFHDRSILRCPKCRQTLTVTGVDHDQPAFVTLCRSCDHGSQDPDIGFRCLDCGARDRADRLIARRMCSYRLTQAGRDAIIRSAHDPVRQIKETASIL